LSVSKIIINNILVQRLNGHHHIRIFITFDTGRG